MKFIFDLQRFGTPTPADLMIGAGKVYFRRWDGDGNPTVRRHLGNVESFNLTPTIEKIQKNSSMDAARELYAEAVKSQSYKATLTIDEFNPYNLALGLYGDEGIEEQAQRSVADELHTVTLGSPISVPYKNISQVIINPLTATPSSIGRPASFAVVGSPGTGSISASGTYIGANTDVYYITITQPNSVSGTITDAEFTWKKGLGGVDSAPVTVTGAPQSIAEGVSVTFAPGSSGQDFVAGEIYAIDVTAANSRYLEGIDYIIDDTQLRAGVIPIPDTSHIPDGAKVRVSYNVPEAKYPKIMGGVVKKIEGDLLFIGDPSLGRSYVAEFWHVSITPTGDIGLIGEDWGSFTLEMTVLSDRMAHPGEPFFKITNVK